MRVSIPFFFFRYGLNHQVNGSAHQGMGEPEDSEACHATHESLPADVAEEPAHVHVFHLHQGKAADGSDAQYVAACHHAVGYYLPVESVGAVVWIQNHGWVAQSHYVVQ